MIATQLITQGPSDKGTCFIPLLTFLLLSVAGKIRTAEAEKSERVARWPHFHLALLSEWGRVGG